MAATEDEPAHGLQGLSVLGDPFPTPLLTVPHHVPDLDPGAVQRPALATAPAQWHERRWRHFRTIYSLQNF